MYTNTELLEIKGQITIVVKIKWAPKELSLLPWIVPASINYAPHNKIADASELGHQPKGS
jgi:hypothetical protein